MSKLPFDDLCFMCYLRDDLNCTCKSLRLYNRGKIDAIDNVRKMIIKIWNAYLDEHSPLGSKRRGYLNVLFQNIIDNLDNMKGEIE